MGFLGLQRFCTVLCGSFWVFWGSGCRIWGTSAGKGSFTLGLGCWGSGLPGSGFLVHEFRGLGPGFRGVGFRIRVQALCGLGCRV